MSEHIQHAATQFAAAWRYNKAETAVGDLVTFVLIVIVATLVFEAAWRVAFALLVFGPPAYAAVVAGWFAYHSGSGLILATTVALATGLAVCWLAFFVVARSVMWTLSGWEQAFEKRA